MDVYRETSKFPTEEKFGLASQIRRAAVSIPANVAEGAARGSKKEFARSLMIARGSASELSVLIDIAKEVGYLSEDSFLVIRDKLRRTSSMASGLITSTRKTDSKP